jgi:hypothetical protein
VKVAACHRSVLIRRQAAISRSPNARRSPCCGRRNAECGRSPAVWGVVRRRSLGSCGATRRPAAGAWTTGPRSRSGMLTGRPADPNCANSPPTTGCGSTCKTGWPARSALPTAARWLGPRCGGSGGATGAERTGAGQGRGARNRSPTGCRSTSPRTRRCGSHTRPSTRPSTSKDAARCGVSCPRACGPGARCASLALVHASAARSSSPRRS